MAATTLHEVALSSSHIVVECSHCIHRAPLTAEIANAKAGDMRTLEEAGVRCGKCGSCEFAVNRFETLSKARSFLRNV